jgi:hypothetical protein
MLPGNFAQLNEVLTGAEVPEYVRETYNRNRDRKYSNLVWHEETRNNYDAQQRKQENGDLSQCTDTKGTANTHEKLVFLNGKKREAKRRDPVMTPWLRGFSGNGLEMLIHPQFIA